MTRADLADRQSREALMLGGIRIVAHPLLDGFRVPVLRIRDEVPCAEPFRSQMNAWLLEMFGSREVAIITQGTAYMSTHHTATIINIRSPQ